MTGLLVSVRSADEAAVALESGADLIDAKEPQRGALGPVDPETLREILEVVQGRVPVSAALGELLDGASFEIPDRLAFAKLGLAGCSEQVDWPGLWRRVIATLPVSVAPVAVVYADWELARAPRPEEVLSVGRELGCRTLLIDTWDKTHGSLPELWSRSQLATFVAGAQEFEMQIVLAGSLSARTIPGVLDLQPAYVAVRGAAAFGGDRDGVIDPARVRQLAAATRVSR